MTTTQSAATQSTTSELHLICRIAADLVFALLAYGVSILFVGSYAWPFFSPTDIHAKRPLSSCEFERLIRARTRYDHLLFIVALAIWALRSAFQWRKYISAADMVGVISVFGASIAVFALTLCLDIL